MQIGAVKLEKNLNMPRKKKIGCLDISNFITTNFAEYIEYQPHDGWNHLSSVISSEKKHKEVLVILSYRNYASFLIYVSTKMLDYKKQ